MSTKGQGKTYQWLLDHKDHDGAYCLIWPFNRNPNGYGQLGYMGKSGYAHRMMCELAHGAPPSPDHEAAHSCGNGHMGCAHPKHLSWKTRSENRMDCRDHGTNVRNTCGSMGRLTPEQVQEIRDLKGKKTQSEIAAIYGIHEPSVRDIFLGRTYGRPSKIKYWTLEEDRRLAELLEDGYIHEDIAKIIGRPWKAVSSHAAKLGLKSRRGSGGILLNPAAGQGALK